MTPSIFEQRLVILDKDITAVTSKLEIARHQYQQMKAALSQTANTLDSFRLLLQQTPLEIHPTLKQFVVSLFSSSSPFQPVISPASLSDDENNNVSSEEEPEEQLSESISLNSLDASIKAAHQILPYITQQQLLSTDLLSRIMTNCFGGSDAEGAWQWKQAYDLVEIALAKHLKTHGKALLEQPFEKVLAHLDQLQRFCPTQTKRHEESVQLQQFSSPLTLAYLASLAAQITDSDIVLEPSAGTGLLAVFAEVFCQGLILNELSTHRRSLLSQIFPDTPLFGYNAEHIHDYLPQEHIPNVVLMNPPFSASPERIKRNAYATALHITSALERLQQGGRLVVITANWFHPNHPEWQETFATYQKQARLLLSVGISGKIYAKHGTTMDVRLSVFDKVPADDASHFDHCYSLVHTLEEVLCHIQALPKRLTLDTQSAILVSSPVSPFVEEQATDTTEPPLALGENQQPVAEHIEQIESALPSKTVLQVNLNEAVPLEYHIKQTPHISHSSEQRLYVPYQPQTIDIVGAQDHPSPLVESAAMASIAPPPPQYRPVLPLALVHSGILSSAQLETIIYTGDAHSQHLSGWYRVDKTKSRLFHASPDEENAVRFRKGFFLGDGTGCGKGRQVAAIILDNWRQGRTKAVWLSKSDKLIEDARRDWCALGGHKDQIIGLDKFRQGESLTLSEGILFATYSLLRSTARSGKKSRLEQILEWLGSDFDGVVIFDEAHAMANAASEQGSRGLKKPSQQGLAGLKLQYGAPNARVVYVSATGATTVNNLAYAVRLGLWATKDFPFASHTEFIAEMERGGIAAMEVLCRDLKALGLYIARSLSYEGVRYELLEHELTPEQIKIYDSYAEAFQIIHQNIDQALSATNITSHTGGVRNSQAKSSAYSAFEGAKQRFFNHLLSAMKCPTLIKAIEHDLEQGNAVIVQLVSTNEALLDRRLADIPTSQWNDIQVDITPREYVLDYLMSAFPIHLHEVYSDEKGNEYTRPALDKKGNPVVSQTAIAQRDTLIERLTLLSPVQGALDQILHHFGHDIVAEVTGRSKRILREKTPTHDRLAVVNRPASSGIAEAQAFMDDRKRILVFSQAGGTGRSYHADLNCFNQRLRIHYLLEAGWKADNAIQGLGRSNRTNQKQPPIFRPVTTNVRGEKRFLSTIARRLDSLGALTKGQRQTGGQGLFREDDNLESQYARTALRQFFEALYRNKISCCSSQEFEEQTGLNLSTENGTLLENLPPITQFLNRLLALPIGLQNALFAEFELRLSSRIEQAIANGTYDTGLADLKGEQFTLLSEQVLYRHPSGGETRCCQINQKNKTAIMNLAEAEQLLQQYQGQRLFNEHSERVAVCIPTTSIVDENGAYIERVNLMRPTSNEKLSVQKLETSYWKPISSSRFAELWLEEVKLAPDYTHKTFYLITGLLLPIWHKLNNDLLRIYRLKTDTGEQLLGRVIQPEQISRIYMNFGLNQDASSIAPVTSEDILQATLERKQTFPLAYGWSLKSVRIMFHERLEILGVHDPKHLELLKTFGCTAEIINWQMRVFIPVNDNTPRIIEQIRQIS